MERKPGLVQPSSLLSKQNISIGIAIITHHAKKHLKHCLPPLLNSPLKPRILVVNSSSNDGTVELAKDMGTEVLIVKRKSFNHGATRELARKHLNSEIVVMMTPDAYFLDSHGLEKLINPLIENKASVAYARQIPHEGASLFEAFPRLFNYPETSHIRSLSDRNLYQAYTFFCSNSCAAYLNEALSSIGGFQPTLLGEDTVATAKLLNKGHSIAYVAEAIVKHSHNYSLKQEFQRNFDTGLARAGFDPSLFGFASDSHRGLMYFKTLCQLLLRKNLLLLPYAFLQTGIKYMGYLLGKFCYKAPNFIKKQLSSQDFYWDSIYSKSTTNR